MADFINEILHTEIAGTYDVIVCGGGPAGVCAAIASARTGTKTLLVERQNCLGGMWTAGFVNPLFDQENKTGLIREIVNALKERNAWGGFWNISFHYEYMKQILDHLCKDAGVDVLLNTSFSRTLMSEKTVTGIVTENIDGRQAWICKLLIDATGDASAAADAGVTFNVGSTENGQCQAMTLMFLVGNIPSAYRNGAMIYENLKNAFEKAGKPDGVPFKMPFLIPIPNSSFGVVQLTHMRGYNPLSAASLTSAVMEGREQVIEVVELLRQYDPEFKELELIQTAPMLGVRESRRIIGEYTLTADDLISGAHFEDGITIATFNIDIHDAEGTAQSCRSVKPYQIPYRCMIPKDIQGMLVAGRCISGTHEAMASYRVTGDCGAMGEVAGYAAYESVTQKKDIRCISAGDILKHIK